MEVVDLFSGLGGASQAFLDRGHRVRRFDFDKRFRNVPNTTIADVRDMLGDPLEDVDITLAGFPCQCFSIMSNHHYWPKSIPREDTKEMIGFVRQVREWLEQSKTKYYIIENPMGMMRKPDVLGKPDAHINYAAYHQDSKKPKKPTDLWGRLPPFDRKIAHKWVKAPRGSKTGIQDGKTSAEERSLWPYEFSLAICLAVEGYSPQSTLEEFK